MNRSDNSGPPPVEDATLCELLLWVLGRRRRIRVAGPSMEPTLLHGDVLLLDPRAYRGADPAPGDVVAAHHPARDILMVKRVRAVDSSGAVELVSDNPRLGSDSRQFGAIPRGRVQGRVTCRLV